MTKPRLVALCSVLVCAACHRGESAPNAGAEPSAQPSASARVRKRLREDPVAGMKATEQWAEHLADEERERRQRYDRFRKRQHEDVLSALEKARARYDAAKTTAQLTGASAAFRTSLPALKMKISEIDPDRQSSALQGDYDSLLSTLETTYPAALKASLSGDSKTISDLKTDFKQRIGKAHDWLDEDENEDKRREHAEHEHESPKEHEAREEREHEQPKERD